MKAPRIQRKPAQRKLFWRHNYTNLHLAQLFSCSVGPIANIISRHHDICPL